MRGRGGPHTVPILWIRHEPGLRKLPVQGKDHPLTDACANVRVPTCKTRHPRPLPVEPWDKRVVSGRPADDSLARREAPGSSLSGAPRRVWRHRLTCLPSRSNRLRKWTSARRYTRFGRHSSGRRAGARRWGCGARGAADFRDLSSFATRGRAGRGFSRFAGRNPCNSTTSVADVSSRRQRVSGVRPGSYSLRNPTARRLQAPSTRPRAQPD